MAKIYLVCPVRQATPVVLAAMEAYVDMLEAQGHQVHYPPRDVDQRNDDGGVRICWEHRQAMAACDEVHTWWDDESKGSHFDLGMAFMLDLCRQMVGSDRIKFVCANNVARNPEKSFTNVLRRLCDDRSQTPPVQRTAPGPDPRAAESSQSR